jgi:hypothetical protein
MGMAKVQSGDIATKDIRKTIVCDTDEVPTAFEAENTTTTGGDGTIKNTSLIRLYALPDSTVWESTMNGIRKREDIAACVHCRRPLIRLFARRNPTWGIYDRTVLKPCIDCNRLACVRHRVPYYSDSSETTYRCGPCAVRHFLRHVHQWIVWKHT